MANRSDLVTKEFNSLADLIVPQSSGEEDFKLNLFPEYNLAADGSATFGAHDNVINIDLGKTKNE